MTLLQERFISAGFEGLDEEGIIELLLSLSLPSRRARKLAKECIERFKSLAGFLAASPQELQQLGMTPQCIFCIELLRELPEEILKQKIITKDILTSSSEVFDYLYYSMRDLTKEVFKVIYLDKRGQIIDIADLFQGTGDGIAIHPREIVESAIRHDVGALVFVHNHPSGDPTPSRIDKQLTRDLVFMGNVLQIKVLDHIIIGDNVYFSFTDEGLIQKYEDNFLTMKIKSVAGRRALNYGKVGSLVP